MAEIELDDRYYQPDASYTRQPYQESQLGSYQGSQHQPQYQSRGPSYSSEAPRPAPRVASRDASYQGSQQQIQYQPRSEPASFSRDYSAGQPSGGQEQPRSASLQEADMVSSAQMLDGPAPDHMSRSTASLFICFLWGIFAWRASNKVRKLNRMKAYDEALYYSTMARQHNESALACFVICLFIFGVPAIVSLATQGSISKYPSAREFFG